MPTTKGPRPTAPAGSLWLEDAAAHLGLTPATLRKWRLLGKDTAQGIVGFKVGRYVAYRIADLDAYLERQYQAASAPDPAKLHDSRPPEPRAYRRPKARVAA